MGAALAANSRFWVHLGRQIVSHGGGMGGVRVRHGWRVAVPNASRSESIVCDIIVRESVVGDPIVRDGVVR